MSSGTAKERRVPSILGANGALQVRSATSAPGAPTWCTRLIRPAHQVPRMCSSVPSWSCHSPAARWRSTLPRRFLPRARCR